MHLFYFRVQQILTDSYSHQGTKTVNIQQFHHFKKPQNRFKLAYTGTLQTHKVKLGKPKKNNGENRVKKVISLKVHPHNLISGHNFNCNNLFL